MLLTSASRLAIIDVQAKLLAAVHGHERVLQRCRVLAEAARILSVPAVATEQNPAGIGPTVETLAELVPVRYGKTTFSSAEDPAFLAWAQSGGTVVLCGTEAHICVLQTALGLRAKGIEVSMVADATGSRDPANKDAALARAARHGVDVVTAEMVLFEWLGRYDRPEFKQLLPLIKALG